MERWGQGILAQATPTNVISMDRARYSLKDLRRGEERRKIGWNGGGRRRRR
jgi:hypothetical protein